MLSTYVSSLNKTTPTAGRTTDVLQNIENSISINNQNKTTAYLDIETIQKMIMRFLTEKQIPKQGLAEALGISVRSLLQLSSPKAAPALMHKINLSLVKLYCSTKFEK